MKLIITEAQYNQLLEIDTAEQAKIHKDAMIKTGFWGKAGAGCIIMSTKTGRILMPLRSKEVKEPGTWGTWGGAIDEGESPKEAVMREVSEEAGYVGTKEIIPLHVFKHESGFVYYNFLILVNEEFQPRIDAETDRAYWYYLDELPKPLHFGMQGILNDANDMNIITKYVKQIKENKVSTKTQNQPFDTRVEFDDGVYIARNKTTVPPISQGADGVKYKPISEDTEKPMVFWHGGNLDDYSNDTVGQKSGKYEYGPGLYLITKYSEAIKYAKGNRKLYQVTVNKGVDMNDATIDADNVKNFVTKYVIGSKRKELWDIMTARINEENKIPAYIVNNLIINYEAVRPGNTKYLRQFYIDSGIDYCTVDNPFGWGNEKMLVLFNMSKIANVNRIKSTDKIDKFDLNEEFIPIPINETNMKLLSLEQLKEKYPKMKFTLKKKEYGVSKGKYIARADIETQGDEIEYLGAPRGSVSFENGLQFLNNIASENYDKYY